MVSWLRDWFLRMYMRTPDHPAKYRIVRWLGRNVFPVDGIVCQVYPEIKLMLHPRDWIEYNLLQGYTYEPKTLEFIAKNLSEGQIAFLAGVNFGLHVAVAARAVGESGLVVGIEPQPLALIRATSNLRSNGLLSRVKLVSSALGAREAFAEMAWSTPENAGTANLFESGSALLVSVVPIQRVLGMTLPKTPRILLLDVEGYEFQILTGLDRDHLPEIIIVEVEPKLLERARVTVSDITEKLQDLGYRLYSLSGSMTIPPLSELPEHNLIGVKPGSNIAWPS